MEASKSAKLYQHKTEGVQKKYGIQLLDYLPIKDGDIIGDIGCGSGNLAALLSKSVIYFVMFVCSNSTIQASITRIYSVH